MAQVILVSLTDSELMHLNWYAAEYNVTRSDALGYLIMRAITDMEESGELGEEFGYESYDWS